MFREFYLIVSGGMVGTAFGAGFGAIVGLLSPEFINLLAHPHPLEDHTRFATALGMICGLFIGAAAMAVGRFITALRLLKHRGKVE